MFDIETATNIMKLQFTPHILLLSTSHTASGGIVGVNVKGEVVLFTIAEDKLIPYVKKVLKKFELALQMAVLNNLTGAEELCLSKFNLLLENDQNTEAARFAALAEKYIANAIHC